MAKRSRVVGINWVLFLFYNPCDPLPWIYIELAFPAILLAIWEYLTPGWKDIIQYATGKSWIKHGKQNIGAKEVKEPTFKGKGLRFLFEAAEELDKRAWQFMVFEVLYDAYMLWHSMVWDLGPCNPDLDRSWGRSKLPLDGRPFSHDWQAGVSYVTQAGDIKPYVGSIIEVPPGHYFWWIEFDHFYNFFTGEPLRVQNRIRVESTGQILWEYTDGPDPKDADDGAPLRALWRNPTEVGQVVFSEVRLLEGQNPLVWSCEEGFISVGVAKNASKFHDLSIPTVTIKSVRTRHGLIPGKSYKRRKQSETDTNDPET